MDLFGEESVPLLVAAGAFLGLLVVGLILRIGRREPPEPLVTERRIAKRWRRTERPPLAEPGERALERERTQRPASSDGPSIRPPVNPPL